MPTIRRFEDIECWQVARGLVKHIYDLTKNDGFKRDCDLVSQIRRSAVSSMANIAEGFHRSGRKDFMKFLDYSRASVAETLSHGYVAFDQGYISPSDMEELKRQTDIVWKKINNFITYLNTRSEPKAY